MINRLRTLWSHRHFVVQSVRDDYRGRFARSRIGTAWMVLHPLMMALVYAIVLSEVLSLKLQNIDSRAGYALYLLSGIVAWSIFADVLNRGVTMFIDSKGILTKVAVPKIVIPVTVAAWALTNFTLLFAVILVIFMVYGQMPDLNWILLLLPAAVALLLGSALGLLLGVMNVFARDVGQVMQVVVNIWFWLTPIVYSTDMTPEGAARFIELNPMTNVVKGFQDVMVYQVAPDLSSLLYPLGLAVGIGMFAALFLLRGASELVDAL